MIVDDLANAATMVVDKGEYGLGPQKIRIEESAVIFVANPNKPHNMELP